MSSTLTKHDRYCIEICKAKCCYTPAGIKCPKLGADYKCSIHHLWSNNTCNFNIELATGETTVTTSITEALESGKMDPAIVSGCCYAHPELLDLVDDDT